VEIARSLAIRPQFLLLDEPFRHRSDSGAGVAKIIGNLRLSGIGILVTDHNVRETLAVTDRAYIINNGRSSGGHSGATGARFGRAGGYTSARASISSISHADQDARVVAVIILSH